MDFAETKLLWMLLAAPVVSGLVWLAWRRRMTATARWASRGLWDRLLPGHRPRRMVISGLLLGLTVAGATLALTRPRWGTGEQQVERQGVDVVFVLDTSLSMATRDVQPSRMWIAQTLLRDLIQRLPSHRTALVQAEGDGVVMVPLTVDSAAIGLLLDAVQPGTLPTPGTELAKALELALGLFPDDGDKHRVMVLISDGEDHGSAMRQVATRLEEAGIMVHTVGVGTPEGKPLELPNLAAGQALTYKKDEDGNVVVSRLQEETLESLSRTTGGIYLRATSAALDTDAIVSRIEAMESKSFGSETISALEEQFQWPVAIAILALAAHLALPVFVRKTETPS